MADDEIINYNLSGDLIEEDKRMKKILLVETITSRCASSSHDILQKISHSICDSGDGSKLDATVLCGGATNFSYKVFVDNHPELCVFAKLCFEYALWNPDRTAHYDLQRVENEYKIMKDVSSKSKGCVVSPLACWDVKQGGVNMKLFVTEWSKGDEQFGNQFIDGVVDPRIAPQIADTLATLNNIKDFDPDFNKLVKPCIESIDEHMKAVARAASQTKDPSDRTEAFCVSLGEEVTMKIMDEYVAKFNQRDCLCHYDSHVFNILVEAKPSIEELEDFGPNGTMVLCDWEMTMAGPIGRDIGLALPFPIGCMIAHGLKGQWEESIEVYINSLIDTYCSRMVEAGKTTDEIANILRNMVGICGWFMYLPFYILNIQDTAFPVDAEYKSRHHDALGILGLKFMRLGFDTDYMPDTAGAVEIRALFNSLLKEEVDNAQQLFASRGRKMQSRKSSMLRTMNRRLSDTEMFYLAHESMKRFSISGSIKE